MLKGPIILMYHNIAVPPKGARLKGLYVTPGMFRFQMWYLKAAGFEVVSLNEIVSLTEGRRENGRLVAITFDDGYQDFYDNAYPVLKKYNFPSTVFLVSELIGKENTWDYKNLNVRKPLMGLDVILKIRGSGVSFGSHTRTHPFLSSLTAEEIETEVFNSKLHLEDKLQVPVEYFCYPYGDYDERVIEAVKRAGYRCAMTTKRGRIHLKDNPFEMRRSIIRLSTNPLLFLFRMHTDYEDRKSFRRQETGVQIES